MLFSAFAAAIVFGINAVTYLFAILGIWLVRTPQNPSRAAGPQGFRRLTEGFAVARRDPLIRRILVTLVAFSASWPPVRCPRRRRSRSGCSTAP